MCGSLSIARLHISVLLQDSLVNMVRHMGADVRTDVSEVTHVVALGVTSSRYEVSRRPRLLHADVSLDQGHAVLASALCVSDCQYVHISHQL